MTVRGKLAKGAWKIAIPTVLAVAVAGSAVAYLIQGRRDVTTSSSEAYRKYELGRENEQKMYHREAMASYAEALALDPQFAMATIRLAELTAARDAKRARSLLQCATRCVDRLTHREKLLVRLAEIGLNEKNQGAMEEKGWQDAKAILDEYVRRYPRDPEGYLLRAGLFHKRNKSDESLAEYQKLLQVDPNYAFAYNVLGYHWMSQGEIDKAEDSFKRYRFLVPEQANPHDSLGELYARIGRYDEAEASLRKALTIKPDFTASWGNLGLVALGRGRAAEAAENFRKAVETTDVPFRKLEWGSEGIHAFLDAGDVPSALKLLAAVEPLENDLDGAERRRFAWKSKALAATVYARLGQKADVDSLLAQLEHSAPESEPGSVVAGDPEASTGKPEAKQREGMLSIIRGIAAAKAGQNEQAIAELSRALELRKSPEAYYPAQFRIRILLARSLAALGRSDDAAEVLKPVLKQNPQFQPALAAASELTSARNAGA